MSETSRSILYDVEDVQELLGVSRSKAYDIIRALNVELKKMGYQVVRAGHIPKKFFHERFYCDFEPIAPVKLERGQSQ